MRLIDEVFSNINRAKEQYVENEGGEAYLHTMLPRQTRTAPLNIKRKPSVENKPSHKKRTSVKPTTKDSENDKIRAPSFNTERTEYNNHDSDLKDESLNQQLMDYMGNNESSEDYFVPPSRAQMTMPAKKQAVGNNSVDRKPAKLEKPSPSTQNISNKRQKTSTTNDSSTHVPKRPEKAYPPKQPARTLPPQDNQFKKKGKPEELEHRQPKPKRVIHEETSGDIFVKPDFNTSEDHIEDLTEGIVLNESDDNRDKVKIANQKLPAKTTDLTSKKVVTKKPEPIKPGPPPRGASNSRKETAPKPSGPQKPKPGPAPRQQSTGKPVPKPAPADSKGKALPKKPPVSSTKDKVAPAPSKPKPKLEPKKYQSQELNQDIEDFGADEFDENFAGQVHDSPAENEFEDYFENEFESSDNQVVMKQQNFMTQVMEEAQTKPSAIKNTKRTEPVATKPSSESRDDQAKKETVEPKVTENERPSVARDGKASPAKRLKEQMQGKQTLKEASRSSQVKKSLTKGNILESYAKNNAITESFLRKSMKGDAPVSNDNPIVPNLIRILVKATAYNADEDRGGDLNMRYQDIKKDVYRSFDGVTMTSTILNIDLDELCYCYGHVILRHLKNFAAMDHIVQQPTSADEEWESSMDQYERKIGQQFTGKMEESEEDYGNDFQDDGVKLEESNLISQSLTISKNNSVE